MAGRIYQAFFVVTKKKIEMSESFFCGFKEHKNRKEIKFNWKRWNMDSLPHLCHIKVVEKK